MQKRGSNIALQGAQALASIEFMTATPTLSVAGREVRNTFQLMGTSEDSISLAIAWALANSPQFLAAFLRRHAASYSRELDVGIAVHRHETGGGITDVEIEIPGALHVIIEAKRGWVLPSKAQLEMYARRESFLNSNARIRKILTLRRCK
mgnify:CR=1 FL=1